MAKVMSKTEYKALMKAPARSKYGSKAVVVDDMRFDSKAEANDWCGLKIKERAGLIKNLQRQVPFVLQDAFEHEGIKYLPIKMIMDFVWEETSQVKGYPNYWKNIAADRKGYRVQTYGIKKKMFIKRYGDKFEFREITN